MKIKVITSKESWLYNNRKIFLLKFLKKYSKKVKVITEIKKKLKKTIYW